MQFLMNFTTSPDDTRRYASADELRSFYERYGLNGLELMPFSSSPLIEPDMVIGIHARCIADWMDLDRDFLIAHYRQDLDYAQRIHAKYVVLHVTQISDEEAYSFCFTRNDRDVIDAAISLINDILDGRGYSFLLLMENLWWPGLTFLRPALAKRLLDGIHYEHKGFMLDTGHLLHTCLDLNTQKEALLYLNEILEKNRELFPWIYGIHLHQSLCGAYVKNWLRSTHHLSQDPAEQFRQVFEHIFAIDGHRPFTEPGVKALLEMLQPDYVTLEYITRTKEQHAQYLEEGAHALL